MAQPKLGLAAGDNPAELLADELLNGRKTLRGPFPTPAWAPHVPEIWARRYTLDDENRVAHLIEKNDQRAYAAIVVYNARDSEGATIFRPAHRAALSAGAAAGEVKNAALWIMGKLDEDGEPVDEPTIEGERGN